MALKPTTANNDERLGELAMMSSCDDVTLESSRSNTWRLRPIS
jgi:hypothetical protein